MKNAKYSVVLGACVTALVAWDCSPAQQTTARTVNAEAMKAIDAYCDKRAAKGFEPLPDAGADQ